MFGGRLFDLYLVIFFVIVTDVSQIATSVIVNAALIVITVVVFGKLCVIEDTFSTMCVCVCVCVRVCVCVFSSNRNYFVHTLHNLFHAKSLPH